MPVTLDRSESANGISEGSVQPVSEQTLELHRQALIGRLTASAIHEINNPMQAIQGSAVLALENINDTAEIFDYLNLIQRECARVLKLTSLLRSIYAPRTTSPELIDLNELTESLHPVLKDDLNRQEIQLGICSGNEPVIIHAVRDQVQLALIETIVSFNRLLSSHAVKQYTLTITQHAGSAILEFDLGVALSTLGTTVQVGLEMLSPDLAFAFALFVQQQGKIDLLSLEQHALLRVKFPQENRQEADCERQ